MLSGELAALKLTNDDNINKDVEAKAANNVQKKGLKPNSTSPVMSKLAGGRGLCNVHVLRSTLTRVVVRQAAPGCSR